MRPRDVSMFNTIFRIPEATVKLPLTFSSARTKRLVPYTQGDQRYMGPITLSDIIASKKNRLQHVIAYITYILNHKA